MGTGMKLKVSPPALPAEVAPALTAEQEARVALVALAEALRTPDSVPTALAQAKAVQGQAQVALEGLKVAREAAVAPAEALGTLGDEDLELLRQYGDSFEAMAMGLEREERRVRQCQRWFRTEHEVAMWIMVLCAALFSLDSVRAALGVAEDGHLLLTLAAVAASCQLAWQGSAISRCYLITSASRQRESAERLHHRARRVEAARARAEAATATNKVIAAVLGRLKEVTRALGTLVDAVTRDTEVTPWGTQGQGYRNAAWALEDIVVDLGTSGEGYGEVVQRLEEVRGALVRQG